MILFLAFRSDVAFARSSLSILESLEIVCWNVIFHSTTEKALFNSFNMSGHTLKFHFRHKTRTNLYSINSSTRKYSPKNLKLAFRHLNGYTFEFNPQTQKVKKTLRKARCDLVVRKFNPDFSPNRFSFSSTVDECLVCLLQIQA